MLDRLNRILPLPYPHFMAFAPLDVWARMLMRAGAWRRVRPRYWLRVMGGLFTSALGTGVTLPERVAVGVVMRTINARRRSPAPSIDAGPHEPNHPAAATCMPGGNAGTPTVVCVLGYFRSGTTHLHYLLSCDPRHCTPKWYQVLAPQGFILSWSFLRWFLVPFLASTRPQDDVAIGPEWPAEDDFALCNWSLSSSMPGRMVVPGEWPAWRTQHNLDGASPSQVANWGYHVWAFAWKIAKLNGNRVVLLKNPSHTGRVRELIRAFGAGNVKFIHLTRDPAAVLRSNIAMHRRFDPYLLQSHPGDAEVRNRIIDEYDATERKFLAEAEDLPNGSLARLRYQDLIADPLGQMRRVYSELGLPWSAELQACFTRYLISVRDYRAAGQKSEISRHPGHAEKRKDVNVDSLPPQLEWMKTAFGHDRPTVERVELGDPPSTHAPESRDTKATLLVAALLWAIAWIGIARLFNDRLDWLTWPTGVMFGTLALHSAGKGSIRLGLTAATLTLFTLLVVAYPATAIVFYLDREPMPFSDVWDSTRDGMLATNNLVWLFLGIVSAYRLASRKQLAAPGTM